MKRKALCLLVLLAVLLPVVCSAEIWYCPLCGRKNDSNFCPVDATAKPSLTNNQSGSQYIYTYYFSDHAINFPNTLECKVYTGPGTEYVRAANGKAEFISQSFKYAGLDGDWMFVRCQVKGGSIRYGYIYVGGYRQTVQDVPPLSFANVQVTAVRRTGIWDSLMDDNLGPVCYIDKGTRVTHLCDFAIDGMTLAYVETYRNNQPVRGFVYPDSIGE